MSEVLFSIRDHTATICLNQPGNGNALGPVVAEKLLAVVKSATRAAEVKVIVLTANGRHFCVGGDLAELTKPPPQGSLADETAELRRRSNVIALLHDTDKITVSAIQGACAGAGLALACATNLRFASRDAVFNSAFLSAGLATDFGCSWSLPRIIGTSRAMDMLLRPRRMEAEEALRIGLVSEVFSPEEFSSAVANRVEELACRAPLALVAMKRALHFGSINTLGAVLDREADIQTGLIRSADAVEAGRAFLERRSPTFKGY